MKINLKKQNSKERATTPARMRDADAEKKAKKGKAKKTVDAKTKATGAKATKNSKAVEAMAKARAAAKTGKKKAGASNKPKTFTWKAPETLGTSFPVEVSFATEKDGMPGGRWRAIRVKGRYPTDDERKMFDLSATDPLTFQALISRLSLVLFHPTGRLNSKGQSPRLQPKTQYKVLLRCSRRKADDNITSRISKVWIVEKNKRGKVVERELDKSDLDQRKIKKVNKHLPAAFLRLAELPEVRRRRKSDEDDD